MEYKGYSMCSSQSGHMYEVCPIREHCYRFQLHKEDKDSKFGYYYVQPEYNIKTHSCIHQIKTKS